MFVLHELNALWTKDRSHKRVFFDFCFLDYEFAADSLVSPLCSSLFQTNKNNRKKTFSKNELFNRDVCIALYPFPLRVDRYRRRDWLWRRHDVDGSLGGGKETNQRRGALRQGEVLGGIETSFGLLRAKRLRGGWTSIISSMII